MYQDTHTMCFYFMYIYTQLLVFAVTASGLQLTAKAAPSKRSSCDGGSGCVRRWGGCIQECVYSALRIHGTRQQDLRFA